MKEHEVSATSKETRGSDQAEKNDAKAVQAEPSVKMPREKKKLDLKKYRKHTVVVVGVLALLGAAYHFKGIFVAAVVDGSPISRLSVIRELEKQAGQQALDRLVTEKLIDAEVSRKNIVVPVSDVDAEMRKIEGQVKGQGGTLQAALAQQGMTEKDLRDQLLLQKKLEKILGDKIMITDDEVAAYIAQGGGSAPVGVDESDFKDQVREQLKGQKFNTEVGKWMTAAKKRSNISYFAGYSAPGETAFTESGEVQPE